MATQAELDDYMEEIRKQVCAHCIERPPGGPPWHPFGKVCGIEAHLEEIVRVCHVARDKKIDPYIQHFHDDVCAFCTSRDSEQCPCPLETLIFLAVEAIEDVDERRAVQSGSRTKLSENG